MYLGYLESFVSFEVEQEFCVLCCHSTHETVGISFLIHKALASVPTRHLCVNPSLAGSLIGPCVMLS